MLQTFFVLLKAMALVTAKTIFSTDAKTSVNKSALFLLTFLVVHMLGNLTIFKSGMAFNVYGHMLAINPALKFIELYLGLGFLVHVSQPCTLLALEA